MNRLDWLDWTGCNGAWAAALLDVFNVRPWPGVWVETFGVRSEREDIRSENILHRSMHVQKLIESKGPPRWSPIVHLLDLEKGELIIGVRCLLLAFPGR